MGEADRYEKRVTPKAHQTGGNKMEPFPAHTDVCVAPGCWAVTFACIHRKPIALHTTTCLPQPCAPSDKRKGFPFVYVNYWGLQQVLVLFLAWISLTLVDETFI
jgi:hypothetical protein